MTTIHIPPYRVAVYCASTAGADPTYLAAARATGHALAHAGMGVVYGGSILGTMGAVADGALAAGGEVIGVLPNFMVRREVAHPGLTQMFLVETMHERKAKMLELADAVIALPGGYGTLDELLEAATWSSLDLHRKPCLVVNTLGYYDGLLSFLDTAVAAGFLKAKKRKHIQAVADADEAIEILKQHLKDSRVAEN
jgi:uncharacterized protein (TIGR00730 family)